MKLKGYKLSEKGSQRLTSQRGFPKGLLILNAAQASNFSDLAVEFNLEDVRAWDSILVPSYAHPFLVARVDGICVVVIKKEQPKEIQKVLRKVAFTRYGGEEAVALYSQWLADDTSENLAKFSEAQEAWKREMDER